MTPCQVTMHDLTVTFPGQAEETQFIQGGEALSPGDSIHEYKLVLPSRGTYYFVEFGLKGWQYPIASPKGMEDAFDPGRRRKGARLSYGQRAHVPLDGVCG